MADRKPWFTFDGRGGDRTLAQQLTGLEPLRGALRNKRVLDVGCAEGSISLWCGLEGALEVLGVDVIPEMIQEAQARPQAGNVRFIQGDAQQLPGDASGRWWDVVLALAVLHKLQDPAAVLRTLAECTRQWIVVRLPGDEGPMVVPRRADGRAADADSVLLSCGWERFNVTRGYLDEWIGWYRQDIA